MKKYIASLLASLMIFSSATAGMVQTSYAADVMPVAEKNYYGQIHGHTAENSDGQGTLDEAYDYAKNLAKLDFMVLTDHSNSIDTKAAQDTVYDLRDYNAGTVKWQNGLKTAAKFNEDNKFAAGYAFEMTWSGGPGHMNTFNTKGFVSRNNNILNQKSTKEGSDLGLRAYYDLLKKTPESISQFNHPSITFGNFADFNYYDTELDKRIGLLEVGNGEGAVGSGGYFRAIDQYILALDKGWHVAPTNNQDNHQKLWGDANTCRTVVYTNDLTLPGIYKAFNDRSVWATENVNLDVVYTMNNKKMGTILETTPAQAEFVVKVKNKNAADANSKIKEILLVSNSGDVVDEADYDSNEVTYTKTLNAPQAGYYFVEVIDAAGRYAVTAPIWMGKSPRVGVQSIASATVMPVTEEDMTLTTSFFNNESKPAILKSVKYTVSNDPSVNVTVNPNQPLNPNGTATDVFKFKPKVAGDAKIKVTAIINIDGMDRKVIGSTNFKVWDTNKIKVYCGVDGSHGGEYVSGGKYPNSMTNMMKLASSYNIRVVQFNTSAELIAATKDPRYKMMILSAPSRTSVKTWAKPSTYTNDEIAAIKEFAEAGNTLLFTNIADFGEVKDAPGAIKGDWTTHLSGLQNQVLAGIGSSLRLSDDQVMDDDKNGGQSFRLYLKEFNKAHPLLKDLADGQVYSQYSGSTVYVADRSTMITTGSALTTTSSALTFTPGTMTTGSALVTTSSAIAFTGNAVATTTGSAISPIVFGYETTYSSESDKDNFGFPNKKAFPFPSSTSTTDKGMSNPDLYIPKYQNGNKWEKLIAASETLKHANGKTSEVIVSGGVFMSNFEIQATMDNLATLPYANVTIMENLFNSMSPKVISKIRDVKNGTKGEEFTIEGIATSDVYNGSDANKGYFDCIYLQDNTSGINVFPVSSGVRKGQKLRISGILAEFQGELELKVTNIKILDASINEIAPQTLSTADAKLQHNVGALVKTQGVVSKVVRDSKTGVVSQFELNDGSGGATIFINGYITKGIKLDGIDNGAVVSAIGVASVGEVSGSSEFKNRIRVRDRSEIVVLKAADKPSTGGSGTGSGNGNGSKNSTTTTTTSTAPTTPVVPTKPNNVTPTPATKPVVVKKEVTPKGPTTELRAITEKSGMKDIQGNKAQEAIATLANKGIFKADKNGKFNPDTAIKETEFLAAMAKSMDLKPSKAKNIKGISEKDPNYGLISALAEKGVLPKGYTIKSDATLSQDKATTLISKAYVAQNGKTSKPENSKPGTNKVVSKADAAQSLYNLMKSKKAKK